MADPEVEFDQLSDRAIRGLGPLLLGKAAWKVVEAESPGSWEAFKKEVENEFGLPRHYRSRKILDLKKKSNESDVDYIKRAE